MSRLEPVVLHRGDDRSHAEQLAVGEHVAVDEPPCTRALTGGRTGDAVVEQPSFGTELVGEPREVGAELAASNVLGESDGRNRIEVRLRHIAVVEETHLRAIGEAAFGDRLLCPLSLLSRQGDTECLHAVLLGGMHDHPAPSAADVQQAHAGLEGELSGDEVVLA